jgi:hypothetical protein
MSASPVAVDTDRCDDVVRTWRRMVSFVDGYPPRIGSLVRDLSLDGFGWSPTPLWELIDELGHAADVLEMAVDAVEAVGFDLRLPGSGSDLAVLMRKLERSLVDGRGAPVTDLDDPDEAEGDGDRMVRLGYLPLFGPGGPSVADLNQGGLGDCWFLAALNSLAHSDPERLRQMVTDHGNGTYTVHFPDGSITVDDEFYATSNSTLYARGPSGARPEVVWPLVFEKAAAQHFGGDHDDIHGGWPADAFAALGATVDRTALNPRLRFDPADGDVAADMKAALDDGRPITADSSGAFGMGGAHAWSVTAVDTDTVTVRNPWGHAGIRRDHSTWKYGDGTAVGFAADGDGDHIRVDLTTGEITMPIDVFTANFDHIDIVDGWVDGWREAA